MPDEAGDSPTPKRPADELEPDKASEEAPQEATDFSDPRFDVLLSEIGKRFEPASSLDEAGLQLTTQEVFERLQKFYPSGYYSVQLVFDGLRKLGFLFDDPYKDMNFVWLFK